MRFRMSFILPVLMLFCSCAAHHAESFRNVEAKGSDAGEVAVPEVISVTPKELHEVIDAGANSVVLVNVWATWCQPCTEEFPDILRLRTEYSGRGLRVVLVSADFDTELPAVVDFLARNGVTFPTYFKTGDDMEFINSLNPEWSGALPATFIYDREGVQRRFWIGKAAYEKFETNVKEVMSP